MNVAATVWSRWWTIANQKFYANLGGSHFFCIILRPIGPIKTIVPNGLIRSDDLIIGHNRLIEPTRSSSHWTCSCSHWTGCTHSLIEPDGLKGPNEIIRNEWHIGTNWLIGPNGSSLDLSASMNSTESLNRTGSLSHWIR